MLRPIPLLAPVMTAVFDVNLLQDGGDIDLQEKALSLAPAIFTQNQKSGGQELAGIRSETAYVGASELRNQFDLVRSRLISSHSKGSKVHLRDCADPQVPGAL